MFDEAKINYTRKTIVLASSAKKAIKLLSIRKSTHTLCCLDIVSFYRSVTYGLVELVVKHYAQDLPLKNKLMIRECLKLIQFGIANTLLLQRKIL
jgi:hypothetical protein